MYELIIHLPAQNSGIGQRLNEEFKGKLATHNSYCVISAQQLPTAEKIRTLSEKYQVDINVVPQQLRSMQVGLLITDMDSTLINIECVDEIADFAGKKAEVAAITEAAIRGELDFNASLTRRVSHLSGLSTTVLDTVYRERLRLNPGTEALLQYLAKQNIKTALVSGGFTFFTDKLTRRLGFDFVLSNQLEVRANKLTGKLLGSIVNEDSKARFLQQVCDDLNISAKQAIAVGDGANDLKMMELAGLSVAYRAKPIVQRYADIRLNFSGLDSISHLIAHANSKKSVNAGMI